VYGASTLAEATGEGLARRGGINYLTGHVEEASINDLVFDQQYHTFHNYGYALDPSASPWQAQQGGVVGDHLSAQKRGGASVFQPTPAAAKRQKKRKPTGEAGTESFLGPWAPEVTPERNNEANQEQVATEALTTEENEEIKTVAEPVPSKARSMHTAGEEEEEETAAKQEDEEPEIEEETPAAAEERTVFHGEEERDYQGRTYLSPPSELKNMPHDCYLPKKLVHTWYQAGNFLEIKLTFFGSGRDTLKA
jgi:pre-mRNA-processing factor 17